MISPGVSEAEVQKAGMDFLKVKGAEPRRRNRGGRYNAEGQYVNFGEEPYAADTPATVPNGSGRRLEVEWKATAKKPRSKEDRVRFAGQIRYLNHVNETGGVGLMIDRLEYLERLWPYVMAGAKFRVHDDGTMEVL